MLGEGSEASIEREGSGFVFEGEAAGIKRDRVLKCASDGLDRSPTVLYREWLVPVFWRQGSGGSVEAVASPSNVRWLRLVRCGTVGSPLTRVEDEGKGWRG